MEILAEIADVVKKAGKDQGELQVWGQYIGLKAGRVPSGEIRDDVLLKVEKLFNKAIHGRWVLEE